MPHWGIFLSHHFLVVRRSEPSSSLPRLTFGVTFPVSAFRAIISSLLAFRAITFPFRRSKPSSYLRSVFRAITSQFRHSEPSPYLRSAFKAITSQYRCSESSSSHFQSWRSKPLSLLSLTFKVAFPYWRSKPSFRSTFRAITSQYWRSKPHLRLASRSVSSFDVQSYYVTHFGI